MNKDLKLAIKATRVRAGMTQREAAEKIGITYQTYCGWENHPEHLSVKKLTAIANALGIPAREFFLDTVLN